MTSKITVFGRAWFYETEDSPEIELWEHEFEPMIMSNRSGKEWASEHLHECYDEVALRELLEVPPKGNFQVLFKGELNGFKSGYLGEEEWDEEFQLLESRSEIIPAEFLKSWLEFHENHSSDERDGFGAGVK